MSRDAPAGQSDDNINMTKKKKNILVTSPNTNTAAVATKATNGSQPFGVMWIFLLNIIFFFVCSCFFVYVDRASEATGYAQVSAGKIRWWLKIGKSARVWGITDMGLVQDGEECDFFDGKWVWDDNYPLYKSKDCGFLDQGFRCSENGRPDWNFTHWRWQPHHCNLPRSLTFPLFVLGVFLIFFLLFSADLMPRRCSKDSEIKEWCSSEIL